MTKKKESQKRIDAFWRRVFNKTSEKIMLYAPYVFIAIGLLVAALLAFDTFFNNEKGIGTVQPWDYNEYGTCLTHEGKEHPRMKLYEDSYCDVTCLGGIEAFQYRLTLTTPQGTAINAQYMLFNSSNPQQSCDYECYGKYVGYNCGG